MKINGSEWSFYDAILLVAYYIQNVYRGLHRLTIDFICFGTSEFGKQYSYCLNASAPPR